MILSLIDAIIILQINYSLFDTFTRGTYMKEEKITAQVLDEEGNCIEETDLTRAEVELIEQYRTAGADIKAAVQKILS